VGPDRGSVQSLGTTWGWFRHDWVLFKLLITVLATIVLLIDMETFGLLAGLAADPRTDLGVVREDSPSSTPRAASVAGAVRAATDPA
jgi:hypothetical protein